MKEKNNRIIILISILLIIIICLIEYIIYDKQMLPSNDEQIKENINQNNNNVSNDETKELDLTKPINTTNITYSNPSDIVGDYGISMKINDDKRSITLSIDWKKFGPISTASMWTETIENYQVTGFTKDVNSTFIGELGQDAKGITLFYLMNDKTIEYTPIFIHKTDKSGNGYYQMNYTYDYSSDGKIIGEHFVTKGTLNGISNIIKLYNVDAASGGGWRTTIGATKDGSFYDLGNIIMK